MVTSPVKVRVPVEPVEVFRVPETPVVTVTVTAALPIVRVEFAATVKFPAIE